MRPNRLCTRALPSNAYRRANAGARALDCSAKKQDSIPNAPRRHRGYGRRALVRPRFSPWLSAGAGDTLRDIASQFGCRRFWRRAVTHLEPNPRPRRKIQGDLEPRATLDLEGIKAQWGSGGLSACLPLAYPVRPRGACHLPFGRTLFSKTKTHALRCRGWAFWSVVGRSQARPSSRFVRKSDASA